MNKIYDSCLIGLGPAGIGFLSSINKNELKNTICFDKGNSNFSNCCHTNSSATCNHCKACEIVSGLGGASRFSNGKLSAYPAGTGLVPFYNSADSLSCSMKYELEQLKNFLDLNMVPVSTKTRSSTYNYFMNNGIEYKYYDVYVFQKADYYAYINSIITNSINAGAHICFNTSVDNIVRNDCQSGSLFSITTSSNGSTHQYLARRIIVATGNIDHNTWLTINAPAPEKTVYSYEIGVRVMVPTDKIDNYLNTHGDLKLKYKQGRTYCVSRNGYVISYSANGVSLLEGYADKDNPSNMTNLAVIIKDYNRTSLDAFLSKYKEEYNGIPIKQSYLDYKNNISSSTITEERFTPVRSGNINIIFPASINKAIIDFIDVVLIKTMKISINDITLVAPELKETVNLDIDNSFRFDNDFYIIGAATGKFRGILQSLCSGIRCAQIVRG